LSVICDYVGWRDFFKGIRNGRINPSGSLPDHAYQRLHELSQADAVIKASCRLVYYLRRFEIDTSDVKRLSRWLIRWSSDPLNNCDKLPPPEEIEAYGLQLLTELRASFDRLSQGEPLEGAKPPGDGEAQPPAAQPQADSEPEFIFRRQGNAWHVRAFRVEAHFKPTRHRLRMAISALD